MKKMLRAAPAALALLYVGVAEARVSSITVTSDVPAYGGASFGTIGQYRLVTGVARGEVDPKDPRNAIIQDVALAPRNARGMVEYATNFQILMPSDPAKSNKTMWFDIANRGNILSLRFFNIGATAAKPEGDGFLQKQGLILVWAGWQGDLLPPPAAERKDVPTSRVSMVSVPIATENGKSITGVVRSEWTYRKAPGNTQGISESSYNSNAPGYPSITTDNKGLTLTMRVNQFGARTTVPNNEWAFADCAKVAFPGTPDPTKVCLKNGFDANHIYELVYTAKDPKVMGLGMAAIRDVGSFLRYAAKDDKGTPNPIAGQVKIAHFTGASQTGRLLRTYLHLGFNEDEQGRKVYDGALPLIAGVGDYINVRFSQPGRTSPDSYAEKHFPAQDMPTTYGALDDTISGTKTGILTRCSKTNTCPKIFHVVSDTEYWQFTARNDTTDALGQRDVVIPENVRVYHIGNTQHGGYSPAEALPKDGDICEQLPNANPYTYNIRALMVELQQWVAGSAAPPASVYPRLSDGTLVAYEKFQFLKIPGVTGPEGKPQAGSETGVYNTRLAFDRGPRFSAEDLSGIIDIEPARIKATYPPFVPQIDAEGLAQGSIRTPMALAPLGTYTGWNVRRAGFGEGDGCSTSGSYIPYPVTAVDGKASGDPRASLEARYKNRAGYTKAVTTGVGNLVKDRWILAEDADHAIGTATRWFDEAAKGKLP